jgi:hypothetical protein
MVGISPGANALKRIAKENMRRGGYVVQVDHQTRMGDGKRPRCIVIDQARVPASYEIDFPLIKPRAWGAPERFGGTTPSKPDN